MSQSNRVGHPVRNRKKNRLIFNEDEETSFGNSNRLPLYSISAANSSTTTTITTTSITNNNNISNNQTNKMKLNNSNNSLINQKQQNQQQQQQSQQNQDDTIHSITNVYKGKFNRNIGNSIVNNLKTLLKLPKAYNWVIYEWFYSNIDQILFLDENEFCLCLKDSFPQLKTRYLTRMEWSQIRRLMGKPRRCSSAFFDEERATLHSKHNRIRYLQQNKVPDIGPFKDLPEYIPQSLVVGSRVNVLARQHEGIHFGTIEGVNPSNGTYRIRFNRSELSSLTINDYDIVSSDVQQLLPLSSFQLKPRKQWNVTSSASSTAAATTPNRCDASGADSKLSTNTQLSTTNHLINNISTTNKQPQSLLLLTPNASILLNQSKNQLQVKSGQNNSDQICINGFPVKFLTYMVKASKALTEKKRKLIELQKMNLKIEKMKTLSLSIDYSFKKQYALLILDLERINKELSFYLKQIQTYGMQLQTSSTTTTLDANNNNNKLIKNFHLNPELLIKKYYQESKQLIERLQQKFKVNDKMKELIIQLMCLLIQLKNFRDCEINSYDFISLLNVLEQIRKQIHPNNYETFQNNVEIHIRHIIACVSHLGNVGAFCETNNNNSTNTNMANNSNNNDNINNNNNNKSNTYQSNHHHHHTPHLHSSNDMIKTEIY